MQHGERQHGNREHCDREAWEQVESLQKRIEHLERANAELARISHTDGLTGLPNQRAFRSALAREIKRAQRGGTSLTLTLFDIDDFKGINDKYGHAVGDAILSLVAGQMRGTLREGDILARYGGEEFALLAPSTDISGGLALAEKMRMAVSLKACSVIGLEGQEWVRVTMSAGVATYQGDERTLFNDADRALYEAKHMGKDCVVSAF